MNNIKHWLIYSFIALLAACGSQESADTGVASTNTAYTAANSVEIEPINTATNSSNLLTSLAQLYPNGQLPAERAAQATQDLAQNPAALKLTADAAAQSTQSQTIEPQAVAVDYQPVQRVQNTTLYGAYFFSIYPSEITTALATNPNWKLEGPAFWASLATGSELFPVHRFRNKTNGSYLYSIYETERADIATNYAATFAYEGVAWYARQTPATGWSALYRFRNKTNGTYLFSAYESEKNTIVATYPDVFDLEGIAYYVRQENAATNQLVPLARYAGATGTFQKVNLTMPAGGVLDLALHGTNVRIFDAAMNVVGQAKFSPWGEYQKALEPGAYVIEFQYSSSNAKYAVAYSPTLLAFGNLPQLRNAVYSTSEITTTYHKASFATPAKINFAGSGTSVTIYDSNMQLVDATNSGGTPSYLPVTLPAGEYVFKLMFWSGNSKSVSITSSALPT